MPSPYRELSEIADEMPRKPRFFPKLFAWTLVCMVAAGGVGFSLAPRSTITKTVQECGACRDEVQSFNQGCGGTHVCPHPDHEGASAWGELKCTCRRPERNR